MAQNPSIETSETSETFNALAQSNLSSTTSSQSELGKTSTSAQSDLGEIDFSLQNSLGDTTSSQETLLKVNPYLTFFPHGTVLRVGATYYVEERRKAPDDFVVNHKWGAAVIRQGKWHFAKLTFKTYAIENSSFNHYLYTYCSLKLPLKPTFHANYSFIGKSDTHKLSTDAAIFALLAKSHASSLSLSANIGLDATISPDDTTLAPAVNLKLFHKTKYADFSYYVKVKGKVEEA